MPGLALAAVPVHAAGHRRERRPCPRVPRLDGPSATQRLRAAGYDTATAASYPPDTALVNHYDAQARLGMHQDKDEAGDRSLLRKRGRLR
ncbi:alpha-ketoglutarate-dependent dioxygenase AlkB [Kitasatospora sp. NPDC091335]|uniref:alpha-ketoglutarate-dependent dioxygenase AlkB n=1 Tax=Kitasatospora sp. NPDC091335 TaxID=3364085 RepID=UPI0038274BD1